MAGVTKKSNIAKLPEEITGLMQKAAELIMEFIDQPQHDLGAILG